MVNLNLKASREETIAHLVKLATDQIKQKLKESGESSLLDAILRSGHKGCEEMSNIDLEAEVAGDFSFRIEE